MVGITQNEVVDVPVGSYVRIGVDVAFTNISGGSATNIVSGVPTGVAQTSFGFNCSNPNIAAISGSDSSANNSGAFVSVGNANGIQAQSFWLSNGAPETDGSGGIQMTNGISYYNGPRNPTAGLAVPTEAAHNISIGTLGANGTSAKFTLLPYLTGMGYTVTAPGVTSPTYTFHNMTAVDSTGLAPTLTIDIGPAPAPAHAIISLTNGTTPAVGYGSENGVISVAKGGSGYGPAFAVGFTASNLSSVSVVGFRGTDSEIYALALSQDGLNIPEGASVLNDIVGGINGTNGLAYTSFGVTASLITQGGIYAGLFPGYDILITSTSGISGFPGDELGFDFNSLSETNPADASITVTAVSAIPEPTTAGAIMLGGASLLLRRRRTLFGLQGDCRQTPDQTTVRDRMPS